MTSWDIESKIRLLKNLVEINSGTQNVSGVNQVQDLVAQQLKAIEFETEFHENPDPAKKSGKLLIGQYAPPGCKYFLDFVTHADTVFEKDSGFLDFSVNPVNPIYKDTATGPGVIDDKGGIVVALSGIQLFLQGWKKKSLPLGLRLICTPSEELGSPGFHSLLQELSKKSKMILGFEPSLEDGSIIESRRGNRWYQIQVLGTEGHVGRDFPTTVNAAHELAFKITHLHSLNHPEKNITVSTGQISGGQKINIVCGEASAKVDVRFSDFENRDHVHQKIEQIVNQSHIEPNSLGAKPKSHFTILDDCPPFEMLPNSKKFLDLYLKTIEEVENRKMKSVRSGGSADANYMSRPGLPILDGLGPTGGKMHQKGEFIYLPSLDTRSLILSKFLEKGVELI